MKTLCLKVWGDYARAHARARIVRGRVSEERYAGLHTTPRNALHLGQIGQAWDSG